MYKLLDGALIKRPHQNESYSEQELIEFMRCADPVSGPLYFMKNYFYIQHPVKGQLLFDPFEYQVRLIDVYHNNTYSISMLPRQSGKSTCAAGYLLWRSMFCADSTILVAAHKSSGAQEIMQRIRYAYELCPDFIRAGVINYNKGNIDFDNGSRIVSSTTTETTGRGMALSLVYLDEFAYVRPTIAKEFWTSISPTLSTGGRAIITSTPNSDEDQFAQIWREANKCLDEYGNETEVGINGFKAYRAYWHEHPDRDEEWKARQIASMGDEDRWRREFENEFIIFDETLINSIKLLNMSGVSPIETHGSVRWYKKPSNKMKYLVALDPSLGTGGDFAAIQVFEIPGMEQIAEWKHNKTTIPKQVKILIEINQYLAGFVNPNQSIYYSVENNTLGEAALISIADVGEENIPGIFLSEPKSPGSNRRFRKGFNTTNRSKLSACAKLKTLIEADKLIIHSKNLVSELKTFVSSGSSYEAKTGEHDDLVMATLLIIRMASIIKNYDPLLEAQLRDSDEYTRAPMPFIMF